MKERVKYDATRVKIVFLDIDGVLNSHRWFATKPPDRGIGHLDPEACARLQRLCDESGASIVVSSTWRLLHKLPALRSMLRARGVTATILGVTPSIPRSERGHEIAHWLGRHEAVTGIVILDDDSDMAHLAPWHVKTHFDRGLTDWEVNAAQLVLARPSPSRVSEERADG